jgi:hypothetical protein
MGTYDGLLENVDGAYWKLVNAQRLAIGRSTSSSDEFLSNIDQALRSELLGEVKFCSHTVSDQISTTKDECCPLQR